MPWRGLIRNRFCVGQIIRKSPLCVNMKIKVYLESEGNEEVLLYRQWFSALWKKNGKWCGPYPSNMSEEKLRNGLVYKCLCIRNYF